MTRFTDSKGGEWELALTVGMLEKLQADAEFDLDEVLERPAAVGEVLGRSPRKLGAVLWVLCEEQARLRKIEPREFAFLFDRPTLDRAADALIGEILLFYPRSSAGRAIAGRLPEFLKKMDADIERQTAERLEAELSGTAGGSPASSGSPTPAG